MSSPQESRWAVATLDVSPVERALPKDSPFIRSYFRDWQVPGGSVQGTTVDTPIGMDELLPHLPRFFALTCIAMQALGYPQQELALSRMMCWRAFQAPVVRHRG